MSNIHPTAIIDPSAELADGVSVGPYCCVGGSVKLGEGSVLHSHVVIDGNTTLGANCEVYPFASIGFPPQDLKYRGEPSSVEIGSGTVIREHVTIHPGTKGGGLLTKVGRNCLIMVGGHVAHDCHVGDYAILVNNATLAGHVEIGDYAIVGGLSAIHQFVRVGKHAMIGGMSGVEHDVIPYGSVIGNRARLQSLNLIGLKRRKFTRDEIHELRKAYRLMFSEEGTLSERLVDVAEDFVNNEPVMEIVNFIRHDSSRAICQPGSDNAA